MKRNPASPAPSIPDFASTYALRASADSKAPKLAQRAQEGRVLAARACADLLDLWRGCNKKPCRRAHTCQGDERCRIRPHLVDFKNPNFGRPDFVFSYNSPEHLRIPFAILNHLPYRLDVPSPEQILDECAAEAGAKAATALRLAFRLERRRHARSK